MLGHIAGIVDFSCINVVHKGIQILIVVLRQQVLSIHQVSLQLWILDVQHVVVKLFEFGVGHAMGIELQVVTQDYFEFFSADVAATINNLLAVGIDVLRPGAVSVTMLAEDLRHLMPWLIIDLPFGIRIGIVVPLWDVDLCSCSEVGLNLGALGRKNVLNDLLLYCVVLGSGT